MREKFCVRFRLVIPEQVICYYFIKHRMNYCMSTVRIKVRSATRRIAQPNNCYAKNCAKHHMIYGKNYKHERR